MFINHYALQVVSDLIRVITDISNSSRKDSQLSRNIFMKWFEMVDEMNEVAWVPVWQRMHGGGT